MLKGIFEKTLVYYEVNKTQNRGVLCCYMLFSGSLMLVLLQKVTHTKDICQLQMYLILRVNVIFIQFSICIIKF